MAAYSSTGLMQDHSKFVCSNGRAELITTTKTMPKVCVNMWRVPLLLLGAVALSGPATVLVAGECFGDGGVGATVTSSS